MIGLYVFLFTVCGILHNCIAEVQQFSQFTKTKILQNTCDDSNHISYSEVDRQADCWISCTQDPQCRRFIYCASDSSCNLYEDGNDCIMSDDSASCSCFRKDVGWISSQVITCRLGYYGDQCQSVVKDCKEAMHRPLNTSSKYVLVNIKPLASTEPLEVMCHLRFKGGTQILKRSVKCVPESFDRSLSEYERGFGEVSKNSWIGLKPLHAIMQNNSTLSYYLQFIIKSDPLWTTCMVYYNILKLGNKSEGYTLSVDLKPVDVPKSCGNSITGMLDLSGRPFSTYDVDYTDSYRCPKKFGGGWWFANNSECTRSFLFGTTSGSTDTDNFWLDDLEGRSLFEVMVGLY